MFGGVEKADTLGYPQSFIVFLCIHCKGPDDVAS